MVSNSTEEGTTGARSDLRYDIPSDVLAEVAQLAEAARKWNADFLEDYARNLAGNNSGLILVASNEAKEELDPDFVAARDAAVRDIQVRGQAAGLSSGEIEALVSAIEGTRSMGQLLDMLTVNGFNGVATGAGTRAQALADEMHDAVEMRQEFERRRRELNQMADEWFGRDTAERRQFDALANQAIHAEDENEAREAREQAAGMARDAAYDNARDHGANEIAAREAGENAANSVSDNLSRSRESIDRSGMSSADDPTALAPSRANESSDPSRDNVSQIRYESDNDHNEVQVPAAQPIAAAPDPRGAVLGTL